MTVACVNQHQYFVKGQFNVDAITVHLRHIFEQPLSSLIHLANTYLLSHRLQHSVSLTCYLNNHSLPTLQVISNKLYSQNYFSLTIVALLQLQCFLVSVVDTLTCPHIHEQLHTTHVVTPVLYYLVVMLISYLQLFNIYLDRQSVYLPTV